MKFFVIIPARYGSSRFEGKPLVDIGGKPMIRRVYEQVLSVTDQVCVATDDARIEAAVKAFGGRVVMTSTEHHTGTDRVFEAYRKLGLEADVIINVQGDEPFIDPEQIRALMRCFDNASTDIATLIKPFDSATTFEELNNPNTPKVAVDLSGRALFFSRSVLPYLRGVAPDEWAANHQYYKHIGIYAYRTDVLKQITELQQTPLERAESLEQLRWLENGLYIRTEITTSETYGIDTPDDLQRVLTLKGIG